MSAFPLLSLNELRSRYASGTSAAAFIEAAYRKIVADKGSNAWIHVEAPEKLQAAVARIEQRRESGERLPLFGIPFGVKDNIDVAGMPTTSASPDHTYLPSQSARCVELLVEAGAICMGKTNLDQFATGLSGARSPYGVCASVGNEEYVSGGSSSGSAVAVARGHVSFSLGTDTGGSGRVPAGFNGIVGVKPTIGRVSNRGVVPNCPSLDCISIFAVSVDDAFAVLDIIGEFDFLDPYSRRAPAAAAASELPRKFRFGRLRPEQVQTFGMPACAEIYEEACDQFVRLGGEASEIDFALILEAGQMLFDGPWIAERKASIEGFIELNADKLLPVTRQVLDAAERYSGKSVFAAMRRIAQIKRQMEGLFAEIDAIVLPTAPRPYTISAMLENPVELNNRFGYYTYAANLLDLCAISVPNAVLPCGVPMGIMLFAPAWQDRKIGALGKLFEKERSLAPASA